MENNKKIINNAMISYFLLIVNIMFLFPIKNKYINNSFVKAHTKVAILIHSLFFIFYILFIHFWVLWWISLFNYWLNHIIMAISCLLTFWVLLLWMYKASKWEIITIKEILPKKWEDNLITLSKNKIWDEKEKLTIMLSFIPFFWNIIYWKHYNNKVLQNINKINFIISFLIIILYYYWYSNLSIIILLFYIISAVFINIILITKDELIIPNLQHIPWFQDILIIIISLIKYLISYTKDKNFKDFESIKKEEKLKIINTEKKFTEVLIKKYDIKHKNFIYIPIANLIFIKKIDSRYKLHIINSYIISIFLLLLWLKLGFNNKIQLFLLFPIFYWTWYINRIWYKMPIIYNIYYFYKEIITYIIKIKNKIITIKNTQKTVNLKVWEQNQNNNKTTNSVKEKIK